MFKRILIAVLVLAGLCVILAARVLAEESETEPLKCDAFKPLTTRNMVHIAVVVRDVEKASKAWADLFGMEVPKWSLSDPPEKSNIRYRGKPTDARLKTAFLKMDNLRVEIMEPVGGPSTWQEFLDTRGEGVHHIAFDIKGMDEQAANLEKNCMPLIQRGEWTVYTGGAYAYFDSPQLGVILELLENY